MVTGYCLYYFHVLFSTKPLYSPYYVLFLAQCFQVICLCCRNRSVWRKRKSCPKTWVMQPPSSSNFSKPLRSSWPKRGTQWEHYKNTWKARWESRLCVRVLVRCKSGNRNDKVLNWNLSVLQEQRVELKEGTSVWEEADCTHYKIKLPNMPYDYHSYAFQNNFFFCTVVDGICCHYRNQMFDIWTFQTKIRGEDPDTIFFETHIPSTILAMSEVIYPPPHLIFQSPPRSSVLKGKLSVRQTCINLCNYFLCLFYVAGWRKHFMVQYFITFEACFPL